MKTLPTQEIDFQGSMAFLTRLQSVTDNAELTVITRRDTFEPIQVHTNVKLYIFQTQTIPKCERLAMFALLR